MQNIILKYNEAPHGGEVATLTISRAEHLNSLNLQSIAEIDKSLDELAEKKSVRALIVTGDGSKSFVAGADVKELEILDEDGAYKLSSEGNKVFTKLSNLPYPVIAAVNGFALGGGCELALACDIRIASENAVFALPEVTLGICPGWGGTQRLARLIGHSMACELVFSAKRIDAARAYEIGLVSTVCPIEGLMDTAMELAMRIGRNAPLAVRAAKKSIRAGLESLSLSEGLEVEAQEFSRLFNTSDAKHGLNAFNNKTKYEYKGE